MGKLSLTTQALVMNTFLAMAYHCFRPSQVAEQRNVNVHQPKYGNNYKVF